MKKLALLFVLVTFCLALPGISFAQESSETEGAIKHHKKMKKGGMKDMHGMMMKKMMAKEIVATEDGGVIVLVGNKLMKYDKDLNLVKEVEIKMDMEAMMKKMKECMEMMKKCCSDIEEDSE